MQVPAYIVPALPYFTRRRPESQASSHGCNTFARFHCRYYTEHLLSGQGAIAPFRVTCRKSTSAL